MDTSYSTKHSPLVALLRMARLNILPGGMLAFALGTSMGAAQTESVNWGAAGLGFLVTELVNLAAHFADEYADVDTDTLARRTAFSGGSGVLPAGLVPPGWALASAVMLALSGMLIAVLFTSSGWLPWPALSILTTGLLLGWFYSMPPIALERRGLGEPTNALIGGLLMPLMGYTVQTGSPSWGAVAALLPVFLMVFAGLLGVHWADRAADQATGKRSLVVLLGKRTRLFHHALTGLAYCLAALLWGSILPSAVAVAFLLTLPLGIWSALSITRRESPTPGAVTMAVVLAAAAAGWWFS
jgi:1,4-dihydroxy-2-naphthoate polyprenyltransferase